VVARLPVRGDAARFVRTHTAVVTPPFLPELRLRLATEVTPLWQATEDYLAEHNVPPPFWAFAWVGGQGLARWVLDNPETVRGKRVLDFAAGSGVVAVAAAKAGAAAVEANDIDPVAIAALHENAALNGVVLDIRQDDLTAGVDRGWDVVLAGDVCYEQPMADKVTRWLHGLRARGADVLLADPGRSYRPALAHLEKLANYTVPTTRELEEGETRRTTVFRWRGAAASPTP